MGDLIAYHFEHGGWLTEGDPAAAVEKRPIDAFEAFYGADASDATREAYLTPLKISQYPPLEINSLDFAPTVRPGGQKRCSFGRG